MERNHRVSRSGVPRCIARRTIAIVAVAALGGCSIFMQGPDPNWDGKQKPDCSESYAPVVLDAVTSSSLASAAVRAATDDNMAAPAEVVTAVLGVALAYGLSAVSGAHKYNACRTATATWRAREALRELGGDVAFHEAMIATPEVASGSPMYFCVHAPARPALEICLRERSRCERASNIMGLHEDEVCVAQYAAWCFGASKAERCFAARSTCENARARAVDGGNECSERR